MEHHHDHTEHNRQALSLAFWLNLVFSIIELIGGALTNSTAIMTDALHDFIDAIAIGLAAWLERLSGKQTTDQFTFGFARFSLLSALGMSLFLLIGAIMMVLGAVRTFIYPETVHSFGMLWLAVLGIIVNGLAFLNIRNGQEQPCSHRHHHNQNNKAIMLHLLEDLLGWIAVLIGAVIIYFTNWFWIDGVLAILIAIYIGYNAYLNLYSTLKILLMATPESLNVAHLKQAILNIDKVQSIASLKLWSLDGMQHMAMIHVMMTNENVIDRYFDVQKNIAETCEAAGISEITVQISCF